MVQCILGKGEIGGSTAAAGGLLNMIQSSTFNYDDINYYPHISLVKTIEKVIDDLKISIDWRILDAGCGNGYIINKLYSKGYKNVWGLDISDSGINLIKNNFTFLREQVAKHDLYERNLPVNFSKHPFDMILSIEVIEHLLSPRRYLENLNFWLKKGGILILSTPYHGLLKNLAILLTGRFDTHFNALDENAHIKFFSKRTLCSLLKDVGFDFVRFYGSGRIKYLWKSMIIVAIK